MEAWKEIFAKPEFSSAVRSIYGDERYELIAVRDNDDLASDIARYLKKDLVPRNWVTYQDGERKPIIEENLNAKDVYVITNLEPGPDLNNQIVETFLLLTTLYETCKVRSIVTVMPIHYYQAQDKTHARREPKSARMIARLLKALGSRHTVSIELHSEQIESLHSSMDPLHAAPIFAHYIKQNFPGTIVGVSPDPGGCNRLNEFLANFGDQVGRAVVDKRRDRSIEYQTETYSISGASVKGQVCVIYDDLIRTGMTIFGAAKQLEQMGAKKIIAAAAHGFGFGSKQFGAFDKALDNSAIDEMLVFNTNPLFVNEVKSNPLLGKKVTVLNIANYLAEAILQHQTGGTVKELIRAVPIERLYSVLHKAKP